MSVTAGRSLLHYRLVEKIGAGGMGEVWRAVDSRLGREVAVKVINERLANDPDALARFEREARAVAALSHPNVLALYDVGREEGVSYVVTELLHGSSLRTRLDREPLKPRAAVELALLVAQGLAAAHARGLIHRDLKPENVHVGTDGGVKILDFGLARFESSDPQGDGGSDESAITVNLASMPGTVLGSPGYMSPEQARGQVADARSDQFAFGALLYEMLSGQRAFRGATVTDILTAILREEPPAFPASIGVGPALDHIVRKCLQKDREERYASATDLIRDLQSALATSTFTEEPAIAVLPFVDMSQAKDQDYFCEGMAEEIISALSMIPGLRVAARTSTFQFKGTTLDVRKIGQALHVNKVLEGSVRSAGGRLRVTAQLINVDDGYQVWSERYDRQMEDVFTIQDEIAHSVAHALAGQLGSRPATTSGARKHSEDLEAYHLYLKGRHERYTTRNFIAAQRYFEDAVAQDPRYALAHLGIAETAVLLGNTGMVRPQVMLPRAQTELEYALALAGESAESRSVECALRMAQYAPAEAEAAGRRAIELDPQHIFGWTWLTLALTGSGRFDEAIAMGQRAVEIDSLSPMPWALIGWANNANRQFQTAEAPLRRAVELNARHGLALWNLGISLVGQGRHAEAVAILERSSDRDTDGAGVALGVRAWARAVAGHADEARRQLENLRDLARYRHIPRYTLAWTLGVLGDVEGALEEFERSVDERDGFLQYPLFPGYDPIRAEPRFKAGLESLGLGWAIQRSSGVARLP